MSLALQKSDAFLEDFALQALWYVREAGDEVARKFQRAVDSRLRLLCEQPGIGRWRDDGAKLQAVRLMDGARDLPRRLAEPLR